MRRLITLSLFTLLISTVGYSQTLKFNSNGEFKIVQFTDVHFVTDNNESNYSLELIEQIVRDEQPDLVIFTGDVVVCEPVSKAYKKLFAPLEESNTPFALVFGNHDEEHTSTRSEMVKMLSGFDMNLTQSGDYQLIVKSETDSDFILYMLDSNSYSTNERVDGYGWFSHDQVASYIAKSKKYSKKNGGNPHPSLAFFHIPLPEYNEAYYSGSSAPVGLRSEKECAPKINTGMFAAMLEMGDVMGCFVGHDHVNDYIAYKNGIALAYGRFSGSKTTYGGLTNGCRVINLKSGVRDFTTYIRLRGGDKLFVSDKNYNL